MPHQLTEHLRDWSAHGLEIDRDARLIKNVALAGLESKNGYRYSAEALRNAVPLYENKPVFLDHAANARRPFERSTRDLVGSIVAARFAGGRIRGDIRVVDTEAGRTFLALAETSGPAVGMSHVVLAEKSGDGTLVERIVEVVSVDAVVFPATTASFREQTDAGERAEEVRDRRSKIRGHESNSSDNGHWDLDLGHSPPSSPLPGPSEALLARLDALLPGHFGRHAGVAASDVRRAGLVPGRLVVEARIAETDAPQHFAVECSCDAEGKIILGEKYAPIELAGRHALTEGNGVGDASPASFSPTGRRPNEHIPRPPRTQGVPPDNELDDLRAERDHLLAERDALAARLAGLAGTLKERLRRRALERLLESARLPPYAISDLFRAQLDAAPDDAARRRLIQERRALVERATRPAPHSRERPTYDAVAATTDAALIAAIRRR
ncbi:MAG: hypothetical protein WD069_03680 [Planctomycetales bacterium]